MSIKVLVILLFCLSSFNCFSRTSDLNFKIDSEEKLIGYLSSHINDTSVKTKAGKFFPNNFERSAVIILKHERLFLAKKQTEGKLGMLDDIHSAQSKGYYKLEWYLDYRLGRLLYEQGDNSGGVEYMLYAKSLTPKATVAIMPALGSFNFFLGKIYCDYYDFRNGLLYLKLSLKNGFSSKIDQYLANGNVALAYYRLNVPDSCVHYNEIALGLCHGLNDPSELASMSGNLGFSYLEQGNYDKAYQYLNYDYSQSLKRKKWASAFASLLIIQKIYYRRNDLNSMEASFVELERIKKLLKKPGFMVLSEYYKRKADLYRIKRDYRKVSEQMDSAYYFDDESKEKWSPTIFRSLELKVSTKIHDALIRELQSEEKRHRLIFMMIVGAFVLLAIIALLYVQLLKKKRREQQLIYSYKISIAEQQLQAYLDNIKNKDTAIESLRLEIEQLHFTKTDEKHETVDIEKVKILEKIRESTLITDDGWKEFTKLVEAVHEHFFTNLRLRFPDLTPGEIRIITLVKLKMSTKEMGSMLGISPDSVKKAKQRLRKKLEIAEERDLYELME